MIETTNLTKRYDSTLALDHVGFTIEPGQIVGLLGPNGAGKSTMLKILTGYIPPTEGSARLLGLDVINQSLDIRRRIGYLPETNPLYEELSVYESLEWTAKLRLLEPVFYRPAIRRVIESCGLGSVVGKDISTLSKGYRQRLGLAQAILHDPDILILDEPTSGLDPNQQQEVRDLIQALKQKKTVILSTHLLAEAQSICDRVLIINNGKIVADGTPERLSEQFSGVQRLHLELKAPAEASQERLRIIEGVQSVAVHRTHEHSVELTIEMMASHDSRELIFNVAVENHWPILEMHQESVSLDHIFRQLTVDYQETVIPARPKLGSMDPPLKTAEDDTV